MVFQSTNQRAEIKKNRADTLVMKTFLSALSESPFRIVPEKTRPTAIKTCSDLSSSVSLATPPSPSAPPCDVIAGLLFSSDNFNFSISALLALISSIVIGPRLLIGNSDFGIEIIFEIKNIFSSLDGAQA